MKVLARKGILLLPDILSNAGASRSAISMAQDLQASSGRKGK